MKKGLIVVAVLIALVVVIGGWAVGYKNKFVVVNEKVRSSWAQVENSMQRRADLIPNFVATVKGYAKQEKDIFVQIAEARSKLGGSSSVQEKIGANNQLESALSRLLIVVERYPELKSNQNFMALQDELAGTENRLAVERMRYNESIQTYNMKVKQFPGSLLAGFFGYAPKDDEYFAVAEEAKAVPKVSFDSEPTTKEEK